MQIKILGFSKSSKGQVLAAARLELSLGETGDTITVDDVRVLRNRHGELWLAMPSYSVPTGGKGYEYLPAVIPSAKLKREMEDAVLPAFEAWEREQAAATAGGGQ